MAVLQFSLSEMKNVDFLEQNGWRRWRRDPFRLTDKLAYQIPFSDHDLLLCPFNSLNLIPDGTLMGFVAPDINGNYNDNVIHKGYFKSPIPIDFLYGYDVAWTPLPDIKKWENEIIERLQWLGKETDLLTHDIAIEESKKLSNMGVFVKGTKIMFLTIDAKQYRSITEPFEPSKEQHNEP